MHRTQVIEAAILGLVDGGLSRNMADLFSTLFGKLYDSGYNQAMKLPYPPPTGPIILDDKYRMGFTIDQMRNYADESVQAYKDELTQLLLKIGNGNQDSTDIAWTVNKILEHVENK